MSNDPLRPNALGGICIDNARHNRQRWRGFAAVRRRITHAERRLLEARGLNNVEFQRRRLAILVAQLNASGEDRLAVFSRLSAQGRIASNMALELDHAPKNRKSRSVGGRDVVRITNESLKPRGTTLSLWCKPGGTWMAQIAKTAEDVQADAEEHADYQLWLAFKDAVESMRMNAQDLIADINKNGSRSHDSTVVGESEE